MANILFAWELGGDYGHLSRLLPVAEALTARGHTTVFVVRDLMGAETLLTPHGFRVFQAPLWLGRVTNLPEAISYPEMLMRFGFLNAQALAGVARAWIHLLEIIQPDLVVLDHAPTALLATRGLKIPRIHFGDGFCIPPLALATPHFRWWQRENVARLADSEKHVLACANEVLLRLNRPLMDKFSDLLTCDSTLLCTFPELDHYLHREPSAYLGPIFSLGLGARMDWPGSEGPRIFAYLKAGYAQLENVLTALRSLKARSVVHVSGVSRQTLQKYSGANLVFSPTPADMTQMRHECDLAVCHGGAGTTAAMLLAGKPLVLLPMQMEQNMTAHRLVALGVAVSVVPEATGQLARLLKSALSNPKLSLAALDFSTRHADYDQLITIQRAADDCEAFLSNTPLSISPMGALTDCAE